MCEDSFIEKSIDNFFNVESLGVNDFECVQLGDNSIISAFEDGINFKDGKYHVDMPWIDNKLSLVEPNFNIARGVAYKVAEKLRVDSLYDAYNDVFVNQIQNDVLEEIDLNSIDREAHVWIPHRAVIKSDPQTTTKVRPVLNCSLKTKTSISLNEAAYKGVDLLNSLFSLLLMIRVNSYIVLGDIKQAFLQIKLSNICDRNKFSILWFDDQNNLKAFRYKSIGKY